MHNTSAQRSLQPYLDKYALQAEIIPKSSFLGAAHDDGVCLCICTSSSITSISSENGSSMNRSSNGKKKRSYSESEHEEEVVEVEKEIDVPTFSDIFLIRISKRL